MSSFWNIWVWTLTLGSLVGCFLILRFCLKNFAGVPEGEPTGHTFDGIQELNNPLPKWWSTFFLLTIVWAFFYIAAYGLGNWTGLIGWKSSNQGILNLAESKAQVAAAKENGYLVQYDREIAAADAKYGPIFDAYAERSIEELATDKDALKVGQRLFLHNCSQCHGSNASG
jgi:cytochrome c oxidase cbb3-type subunit 3